MIHSLRRYAQRRNPAFSLFLVAVANRCMPFDRRIINCAVTLGVIRLKMIAKNAKSAQNSAPVHGFRGVTGFKKRRGALKTLSRFRCFFTKNR